MMTAEMKNGVLQQVLFTTIIDSLINYEKHGILADVERERRERDIAEGEAKVQQYGISSAEQFLQFSTETFNCVNWEIEQNEDGFTAVTKKCIVCAMAKQAGAPSPCELTCISPNLGVIKGVDKNSELIVEETLWTGERCLFKVKR